MKRRSYMYHYRSKVCISLMYHYRMRRRKLRAKNKKLMKNFNVAAVTYQAGSFGLSEKPEDITKTCSKKKAEKLAKNDAEPVAPVFIDESQIPLLMTKN